MKRIYVVTVIAIAAFLVLPWLLRASGTYAKWAWAPIFQKAETAEVVQAPAVEAPAAVAPVTQAPAVEAPAVGTTVIEAPVVVSSLGSFPSTVAYTVEMNFKDGTELTKTLMTDLDLEDDKETWDRIQKVGIADLVVTNSAPVLFFYNGYVFPVAAGENQSLGEIWETNMSNDINYDAGFAIRQLANGCRELSSTWTTEDGVEHMQAQTAVNADLASWLVQYCDATEISQWKEHRAALGMPESFHTK